MPESSAALDSTDRAIVNLLQAGVTVCERPFDVAARELGLDETTLIERLRSLLERGVLTRFGPMFDAERLGGAFTLCAMCVPSECFDEVSELVNAYPEVAHNYERDHAFNMWFVIAADRPERIDAVVADIVQRTGIDVLNLPKLEEFFVGLRLDV